MPNIKPIDAGVIGFRPSDMGVEAAAATGRRIGAFYNQAAQAIQTTGAKLGAAAGGAIREAGEAVDQYETHSQVSAGAAHGAQVFSNLIESKDAAVKEIDPGDPGYGAKVDARLKQWREQTLEPTLQQFGEGFTTRKSQAWADHFIATTRDHMFHQTASDASEAAGIGVHNAMRTTMNTASNTVLRDPSSLDAQLDLIEHSWRGTVNTSPMKGVAAAKVMTDGLEKAKEQLVKAAVQGAISKASDPEAIAENYIKKYPQYINGDEARTLANNARSQTRARRNDERAAESFAHTQQVRDGQEALAKSFTDSVAYENGQPVIKPGFWKRNEDIAVTNPAVADHARALNDWATRHQDRKVAAASDPATKQGMIGRFESGDPPTQVEILKAEANGKLNTRDGTIFRQLQRGMEDGPFKDPTFKVAMDGIKGRIGTDPVGRDKYADFFQKFAPAYLALPPAERPAALNPDKPGSLAHDLLNQGGIIRSVSERMRDRILGGQIDPEMAQKILENTGVNTTTIRVGGQTTEVAPTGYPPAPPGAINDLRANPSPERKKLFEKHFGPGSADKALKAVPASPTVPISR